MDSAQRPDLAADLLARRALDEAVRAQAGTSPELSELAAVHRVELDNTLALRRIIGEHGWPGRRLVGERAAEAAFALVLHADTDPQFQELALSLLVGAAKEGDTEPRYPAYLTDRLRLRRGLPQLYGTQYTYDARGELVLEPVAEPARLDARRAALGLRAHDEYDARIRAMYPARVNEGTLTVR